MVAPSEVQAPSARVRRIIDRIASVLRHEVNNPLQVILSEAQILAGGEGSTPDAAAAATAIEQAARRIAAVLSDFEEIAASELEGADAAGTRTLPPRLTRALVDELTLIARQTDSPLPPRRVALLQPRFRRVARLANIWLAGSEAPVDALPPQSQPPVSAGRTFPAVPSHAAAIALADRLERLEAEHRELKQRIERRERYWRFAMHELRNAANAFTSWAYALRSSEVRDTPWFTPLLRAASTVLRRAEEALNPQAAERGEFGLRTESVDLIDAAHQALDSVRPTANLRQLALTVATPPGGEPVRATADPDRVHQILHNLLRNAIAATPPGGSIRVATRNDNDFAVLEVEDTGPGVAPEIVTDLFRADITAPPRTGDGTGLGLPLSRHLAEQLGGSLILDASRPESGARFVLRLPRARP